MMFYNVIIVSEIDTDRQRLRDRIVKKERSHFMSDDFRESDRSLKKSDRIF
jgi:hypothetical protein